MRTLIMLAAAAGIALGQTAPEILKKVAETYRSAKSYQFEAQVVTESVSESHQSRTQTTRISAAILPDRRHLETKGGGRTSALRVFDGKTVWEYRPGVNQFARQDQAAYQPARMNMLSDAADQYKALDKAADAKLLREESVEAEGSVRLCWVVEVPSRIPTGPMLLEISPTTYWVDKSTNLVLKELQSSKIKVPMMDSPQAQTTATNYTVARINEAPPDELFHFQPPANAAEVAEFNRPFGAGSTMLGKSLPEFTVQDLAGKEVTASSLKGKPLLINFWATWCEPCREQMPRIQEAQRALADKGLVVLAINDGESDAIARNYIEEHEYTFHVLLDRDKTVANKFGVSGIPSLFQVDASGNIKAQFTGYSTGLDLREELKKIGF